MYLSQSMREHNFSYSYGVTECITAIQHMINPMDVDFLTFFQLIRHWIIMDKFIIIITFRTTYLRYARGSLCTVHMQIY